MEINHLLLEVVNKSLNQRGTKTARGNYAYTCPKKHHRSAKLEVNCDSSSSHFGNFSCWGCGDFKGKNVIPLLKFVGAPIANIQEAKDILKVKSYYNEEETYQAITLPKEFKNFNNTPTSRRAIKYLKSRRITQNDIDKYGLGYCESGIYKNMIIIPSYDSAGNLNYFMTRSFEEDPYRKTKNPNISKDIIPFELYINWDLPLVICEGPFDVMAIKRNAIPLLGKIIQPTLMKKIVTSKVRKIYLALDEDAMKLSLRFAEKFMDEGKEVYLLEMGEEDPSSLGFLKFTELIQNTTPLTPYLLLEKKLNL